MARNRTISPKLWSNPKLCRMSPVPRLLFVGLVSLADDAGNVLAEPFYLWQQLFAGDGKTNETAVASAREELIRAKLVELYHVDDVEYIHHPNFERHQQMNRRYSPLYPLAPGQEYERTPTAKKLNTKTAAEASVEPKQLRMRATPSDGDLAAYALLDAAWGVVKAHVDIPMAEKTWRSRNKAAALDLLGAGKTVDSVAKMLTVAYEHPAARKYYGTMSRLDRLAEAWSRLETFARESRNSGTFERLRPPDEAAS